MSQNPFITPVQPPPSHRSEFNHWRPAPTQGWLALAILLIALLGCGRLSSVTINESEEAANVVRVVDGDTIAVTLNGRTETIRYVGIDTPERGQPGYKAATEANRALVGGKHVTLRRDVSERDAFGRLLRYVYLDDGTLVNRELVAQGWAQPVEYKPDTAYADVFRSVALEAAQAERGFWSGDSAYDGAMSYGVVTRAAGMRRGPGSDYPLTEQVEPDTVLTIFGRSPNSRWLQVRLPNLEGGWLPAGTVDANVPVATVPLGEVDGVVLSGDSSVVSPAATPGSGSTARCPQGCAVQPDPTCFIKGNVNAAGEKIYHVPGGSVYSRTQIRPDEGDRWFCTTVEAEASGFRAARR